MDNIIEVLNLTHTYGADTPFEHTAIEDMSFEIKQGEILGLIGHTGSGKSTLIQHLNGLLKPDSGMVKFCGRDIWDDKQFTREVRFSVGLVFQYPEYQLFEETVERDIAFGPTNMKLSEDEIRERVLYAARSVGLDDSILLKSPFELSGGQKRRVALAGVIAMKPKVLILDEPTAGLDPEGREEILNYIKNYNKETGATIVFVTHSMEDIARVVDRIVVLEKSKILMTGTPKEVFSRTEDLIRAGLTIPVAAEIAGKLAKKGIPVSPAIYTIEQLADAISTLYAGGGKNA
ncbi:MAG: energy-coupling factor transporter ATPase [Clostridia bacterium]|nr:energy-coupling factor transporter ATPase [Clostridia bacterium]